MGRGRSLTLANEGDKAAHFLAGEIESWHLVVGTPLAHDSGDLFTGLVGKDKLRLRQVGAGLPSHCVATVTEGAVLMKQLSAGPDGTGGAFVISASSGGFGSRVDG